VSSLIVVMQDMIFSSGGLINFLNSDFREAVEHRYITVDKEVELHKDLVNFFAGFELNDRKVDEYPYHLEKVKSYVSLQAFLVDMRSFDLLYPGHKWDLVAY